VNRHYSYGLNIPTAMIDPTGAKTEILKTGNNIIAFTSIVVATDIGWGDETETNNARNVADRLSRGIHESWNQSGFGWRISFKDSGNTVNRNLHFIPSIYAISEDIRTKHAFDDFDRLFVTDTRSGINSNKEGKIEDYSGTPIPPARRIFDPRYLPFPSSSRHY
jgi:hypothetical protein